MEAKTTDVLVIGGGGAGIAAALAAQEHGAHVLLLEKTEWLGGSTRMSGGGISAPGTKFQKEAGIEDDKQEWLNLWKKRQATSNPNSPYPDYDRVSEYMDEAVTTTEWLADKEGHEYEKPAGFGQDPEQRIHFPKGTPGGMGGGKKLIANISATLEKRPDITVLTKTSAKHLIVKNSEVVGALVEGPEGEYRISAKKVIISSGGFVQNKEMIAKYIPAAQIAGQFAVGGAGDNGDGIQMAHEVGAVLYQDPWVIGMGITAAIEGTGSLLMDWNKLYVDGDGKRFMNEASHYAVVANTVLSAKDPWIIFDSSEINDALLATFDEAFASKRACKAADVESLAAQMGVPPKALAETIAEYNEGAKTGQDKFGKKPENIKAIQTPPFYAARIYPVIMGTFGGVKTNDKYEVLNDDGHKIPNLFATGESANKILYNHVYMSGSSVQFALTSGRIAGETSAEQIEAEQ